MSGSAQFKSYKTGSIYTWIWDLGTSTFRVADAIKDAMLQSEVSQLTFPPIARIWNDSFLVLYSHECASFLEFVENNTVKGVGTDGAASLRPLRILKLVGSFLYFSEIFRFTAVFRSIGQVDLLVAQRGFGNLHRQVCRGLP